MESDRDVGASEHSPQEQEKLESLIGEVESVLLSDIAHEETIPTPTGDRRAVLEDLGRHLQARSKDVPEPPSRLGAFRIEKHLGSGGMGAVYHGVHIKTGAKAAVKVVPTFKLAYVEALEAEVAGLAKINAPNVIRILDAGNQAGWAWAALEWLDGHDLATFIREYDEQQADSSYFFEVDSSDGESGSSVNTTTKKKSRSKKRTAQPSSGSGSWRGRTTRIVRGHPLNTTIAWFRDLARALHAMHEADLVHRDVNPRNIVIAQGKAPYLIDFGLVIDTDSSEEVRGHLSGTIPYMSPEQARLGWTGLGPPSDIYSLAITFHEFLTGKRVVPGSGFLALDHVIFTPVPELTAVDSTLPDSLNAIFRHATQKKTTDRYQTAEQLAIDLDRWLDGDLPEFAPITRTESLVGFASQNRRILLGVFAILIVVASWQIAKSSTEGQRQDTLEMKRSEIAQDYSKAKSTNDGEFLVDSLCRYINCGGAPHDLDVDISSRIDTGIAERTKNLLLVLTFPLRGASVHEIQETAKNQARLLIDSGFKKAELFEHLILCAMLDGDFNEAQSYLEEAESELSADRRSRNLQALKIGLLRQSDAAVEASQADILWEELDQPTGNRNEQQEVAIHSWGKYLVVRTAIRVAYALKLRKEITRLNGQLSLLLDDLERFKDEAQPFVRMLRLPIFLDLKDYDGFESEAKRLAQNSGTTSLDPLRRENAKTLSLAINLNGRAVTAVLDFVRSIQSRELARKNLTKIYEFVTPDLPPAFGPRIFSEILTHRASVAEHLHIALGELAKSEEEVTSSINYAVPIIQEEPGAFEWFADRLMLFSNNESDWMHTLRWFQTSRRQSQSPLPCTPDVIEILARLAGSSTGHLLSQDFDYTHRILELEPEWSEEDLGNQYTRSTDNYQRFRAFIAWGYFKALNERSPLQAVETLVQYCDDFLTKERKRRVSRLLPDTRVMEPLSKYALALRTPLDSEVRDQARESIDEFMAWLTPKELKKQSYYKDYFRCRRGELDEIYYRVQ